MPENNLDGSKIVWTYKRTWDFDLNLKLFTKTWLLILTTLNVWTIYVLCTHVNVIKTLFQWVSSVNVGGLAQRCSLWFVFASVLFYRFLRGRLVKKKLIQIAHHRNPHRVMHCPATDIYWGYPLKKCFDNIYVRTWNINCKILNRKRCDKTVFAWPLSTAKHYYVLHTTI